MKISWADRVRNEVVLRGRKECRAYNEKEKVTWIGHILRRNYFLKHLIEEKLKGKEEDMERRVRRHRQLFDDLKENRGY
jgi:hypothetical protein